MDDALRRALEDAISQALGRAYRIQSHRVAGGGSINEAYIIDDGRTRLFLKMNTLAQADMFAAEAAGLRELVKPRALRIPEVITEGQAGKHAFLILEYIEFSAGNASSAVRLGEGLAALHRHTHTRYGWERDNTLGATPQRNTPFAAWPDFYAHQRMEIQLRLAADAGYRGTLLRDGERLMADLGKFFVSYRPLPSLLHGDLWSGNYAYDNQNAPVIFDPAVYYGDRETDIAMTELFGGFPPAFYAAYKNTWPMDDGYKVRKQLYNLYHVLNHFHLFGGGYAKQAEQMVGRLVSEL
ncbi:MAG: fructosamine kinase family protein [Gammaproteobacteria bacterium]|nr:fructosamine kinase family protein [Gammaproteobacteria bacterium]